jgi:hypothetical protein
MSIQAVAWVLSQKGEDLPGTARLVMIALANHADHTSGHCWPSIETIANEAGCAERTASRYLGALRRNGWIDVRSTQRASGKFRSNDYWILFDHKPAPWRYYDKETEEADDEETVANLPHANLADGHSETPLHEMAHGPHATVGVAQSLLLEPSESKPSAEPPSTASRANLNLPWPKEFVANARAEQKAKLDAAEEAEKGEYVPVIEGSRPWEAHVKAGHSRTLVGTVSVNGRHHRGWYFKRSECDGLYPKPKPTGPPPLGLCTAKDEAELKI